MSFQSNASIQFAIAFFCCSRREHSNADVHCRLATSRGLGRESLPARALAAAESERDRCRRRRIRQIEHVQVMPVEAWFVLPKTTDAR